MSLTPAKLGQSYPLIILSSQLGHMFRVHPMISSRILKLYLGAPTSLLKGGDPGAMIRLAGGIQ